MASDWTDLGDGEIAIAHLSDLHIGSTTNWAVPWRLVRQALLDQVKPSLLLVTGDLVDTPEEGLYRRAQEELNSLAEALGERARGEPIPYYVCPGNHDRFRKGTRFNQAMISSLRLRVILAVALACAALMAIAASGWSPFWTFLWLGVLLALLLLIWGLPWILAKAWGVGADADTFDRSFTGHVVTSNDPRPVTLSRNTRSIWSIGVFGVDSSSEADAAARGWVPRPLFKDFVRRTRRPEWDLCVFLVHHHVLPVRALEEENEHNLSKLFDLTGLANAGSLLDSLSKAHVDLVLHGHEHAPNWGTYKSFDSGSAKVRVLAAGSATGNHSLGGCKVNDATFNVIILSPDRSGRLRRLKYHANEWKVED
jgi:3',5'-cyclic AMP phosphodiesterase CpdA